MGTGCARRTSTSSPLWTGPAPCASGPRLSPSRRSRVLESRSVGQGFADCCSGCSSAHGMSSTNWSRRDENWCPGMALIQVRVHAILSEPGGAPCITLAMDDCPDRPSAREGQTPRRAPSLRGGGVPGRSEQERPGAYGRSERYGLGRDAFHRRLPVRSAPAAARRQAEQVSGGFLHFPDGCPGFSHEQHWALKFWLCSPAQAVAGSKQQPLQNTWPDGHPHAQVVVSKICPAGHVPGTHAPLAHCTVPLGHSHAQLVGLRTCPFVHKVRHAPPQNSWPAGHSQAQVVVLRVCPDGQGPRHEPPQDSVPLGHSHAQVAGLNWPPPGQLIETQTPLHATKPVVHSHRFAPVAPTVSQKRCWFEQHELSSLQDSPSSRQVGAAPVVAVRPKPNAVPNAPIARPLIIVRREVPDAKVLVISSNLW